MMGQCRDGVPGGGPRSDRIRRSCQHEYCAEHRQSVTKTAFPRYPRERCTIVRHRTLRCLGFLPLLAPFWCIRSTEAASVSAVQVATTTHGVKLLLSIPRQTYPRNALVRVTVRLQNVSRHTVLVSGNNPALVVVLDASHQVVYRADTPFMGQELFDQSMARRPTIHLRPHHHLARSYFVILRGPLLQAQATLGAPAKEHTIRGVFVPLTLTEEPAPTVVVTDTPTVHAAITPPAGTVGPPYVVEQTVCTGKDIYGDSRGWDVAPGDDLTPGFPSDCVSNRKWIAYAGWLSHPVATISYQDKTSD